MEASVALKAVAQTVRAADPFATCEMGLTGVCLAQACDWEVEHFRSALLAAAC